MNRHREQYKVCMWTHKGDYMEKFFESQDEATEVLESMWAVPQVRMLSLCKVYHLETRGPRPLDLVSGWDKGWTKYPPPPPQNSDK